MNSKENLLSQPHQFLIAKKTNSLIESSDNVDSLYEQTKNEIVLKSIDDQKVIKSIDIIPNYEVDDYLSSSRVGSSVDPEINIEYGNTSLINKELEDGEQFEFYNSLREKEKMQLSNRTIRTNEDIHQLIQIVTEPYLYIDSSIVEAQSNTIIKKCSNKSKKSKKKIHFSKKKVSDTEIMIKVVPPDDSEELMNQSNAKCGFVHTASGGSSILEALRKKYRNKKKSTRTIRKIEENINLNFQNLNHPEEYYASEFKKLKCTNETIETKIDDIFNLLKQNTA